MLTELSSCRHVPAQIEPDCYDDEAGKGFEPLNRWGDRTFRPWNDRINELLHSPEA